MGRVSGDLLRPPGFPKGPAGPGVVKRGPPAPCPSTDGGHLLRHSALQYIQYCFGFIPCIWPPSAKAPYLLARVSRPKAVPRASEVAAGFSGPFCPVKKERSREFEADPCGPQCIQNKESNPGNVPAGRKFVGHTKPRPTEHGPAVAAPRQRAFPTPGRP